jgi:segregation and condensation protein A
MNEIGTAANEARLDGVGGVVCGNACAIKLQVFEGPLDLLLHLIRLNEVDVTDLPIAEIAQQYAEYVALMHELDLDVAGEYLLMAATLAWIKSRMLLPPTGESQEAEGADPRAELIARLMEYQRFKEVAEQLGDRTLEGRDVFAVQAEGAEPLPDEERPLAVSLVALLEAFRRVLAKAGATGPHEVTSEAVGVRERMLVVMDALGRFDSIEFERIFELEAGPLTRPLLIATFLAVLELVRLAAVRVYQGTDEAGVPEGPIRLRRAEGAGADDWSASVAAIT